MAQHLGFIRVDIEVRTKTTAFVVPHFIQNRSNDLITKGGEFVAVWDDEVGMWSQDNIRLIELVDAMVTEACEKNQSRLMQEGHFLKPLYLSDDNSGMYKKFIEFTHHRADTKAVLDRDVTFLSESTKKSDYRSKRLDYDMQEMDTPNYDKLMNTIWKPDDREKIEWCIGAILEGDAKKIHKFLVMYGAPATGKSTMIDIINHLFKGYTGKFSAEAVAKGQTFSTAALKHNHLVIYDEDSDLSKMWNNAQFNSLVSHEPIIINEKNVKTYNLAIDSFIFLGTNNPVEIPTTNSGLKRRLIDANPTGMILPKREFNSVKRAILNEEIPGIAYHCHEVYMNLGENYYNGYESEYMLRATNPVHEFIVDFAIGCSDGNGFDLDMVPLKDLYPIYKTWCEDSGLVPLSKQKLKLQLEPYWEELITKSIRIPDHSSPVTNVYRYFRWEELHLESRKKNIPEPKTREPVSAITLEDSVSIFDSVCKSCPAQLANVKTGNPQRAWDQVDTTLADIDTTKLHWVRVPENNIVIDFDLKNANGEKDSAINLQEAALWPPTYGEFSKSGGGVHLHYIFDGDVSQLGHYAANNKNVEIKVYTGKSGLRRKLTKCNNLPIAHLDPSFELLTQADKSKGNKGDIDMNSMSYMEMDKYLRNFVGTCLNKKHHGKTYPEIKFLRDVLDKAYDSSKPYDISDVKSDVIEFAATSTNHANDCLAIVTEMKFKSVGEELGIENLSGDPIIFYDVEVFPNVFIVCYKVKGSDDVVKLINPAASIIQELMSKKLVGYNNRKYDAHIMYAWAYEGDTNEQLFRRSQGLVSNEANKQAYYCPAAWNANYADVYEICSVKQSLKKWEIQLGINHIENSYPWDKDLPEDCWEEVADYCKNDVIATEAVWDAIPQDIVAREIICEIAGLPMITGQQKIVSTIIFPGCTYKEAQAALEYTDLSTIFPGYTYGYDHSKHRCVSMYKGYEINEGGRVVATPGYYENVWCFDVTSMHPSSAILLNIFGKYTKNFEDIVKTRVLVKHKQFDEAKTLFDGKLSKYLTTEEQASDLAQALKLVINPIYGYTQQRDNNSSFFYDKRNVDNIVAKRGALFMVDLQEMVESEGYTVVHVKTDSIKVVNADDYISQKIMEFGKRYGYGFEIEDRFDRLCLVNGSTYIGRTDDGIWHAKAKQFQLPYIYKKLGLLPMKSGKRIISSPEIEFSDLVITDEVKGNWKMYLNFNEGREDDNYMFIGRIGTFVPVKPGRDGGLLVKSTDETKYDFVNGSKGYRWILADVMDNNMDNVDFTYYDDLLEAALNGSGKRGTKAYKPGINDFVDFEVLTRSD